MAVALQLAQKYSRSAAYLAMALAAAWAWASRRLPSEELAVVRTFFQTMILSRVSAFMACHQLPHSKDNALNVMKPLDQPLMRLFPL